MRTLSLAFRKAFFGQDTEEIPVVLLTAIHPDWDVPVRFSSDNADLFSTDPDLFGTTSRGEQYNFIPMTLKLPEDTDDAPPVMSINISDIAQEATPGARSISTPAQVRIEMVLASAPDDVEMIFPMFDWTASDISAGNLQVSLTIDALATEPFPSISFTPAIFPGLF